MATFLGKQSHALRRTVSYKGLFDNGLQTVEPRGLEPLTSGLQSSFSAVVLGCFFGISEDSNGSGVRLQALLRNIRH